MTFRINHDRGKWWRGWVVNCKWSCNLIMLPFFVTFRFIPNSICKQITLATRLHVSSLLVPNDPLCRLGQASISHYPLAPSIPNSICHHQHQGKSISEENTAGQSPPFSWPLWCLWSQFPYKICVWKKKTKSKKHMVLFRVRSSVVSVCF